MNAGIGRIVRDRGRGASRPRAPRHVASTAGLAPPLSPREARHGGQPGGEAPGRRDGLRATALRPHALGDETAKTFTPARTALGSAIAVGPERGTS